MQSMRPMLGCEQRDKDSGSLYIRNGLRAEGVCMQVHYLKGYFLLRYSLILFIKLLNIELQSFVKNLE